MSKRYIYCSCWLLLLVFVVALPLNMMSYAFKTIFSLHLFQFYNCSFKPNIAHKKNCKYNTCIHSFYLFLYHLQPELTVIESSNPQSRIRNQSSNS